MKLSLVKPSIFPLRYCNTQSDHYSDGRWASLIHTSKNNQLKSQDSWQCGQEPCELPCCFCLVPNSIGFLLGVNGAFWDISFGKLLLHTGPQLNTPQNWIITKCSSVSTIIPFHQPVNKWSIISTVCQLVPSLVLKD